MIETGLSGADPNRIAASLTPQENPALIKDALGAWLACGGTDFSPWIEIAAEDVHFISPMRGRFPDVLLRAEVDRKAAFKAYFDRLSAKLELVEYAMEHFAAERDCVIAYGHSCWRVRETGRTFRTKSANVFYLRDGKIVKYINYFDTASLVEASMPKPRERDR